jgi:hypothetical protein
MGDVFALSACYGCGGLFTYNPLLVPSLVVKRTREPICRSCVEQANPERVARGLAPMEILPGAYDACEESEL